MEQWHTDNDTVPMHLAAADPLVLAAGGSPPLEVPVDGRDDPVPNAQNEDWGTAAAVLVQKMALCVRCSNRLFSFPFLLASCFALMFDAT